GHDSRPCFTLNAILAECPIHATQRRCVASNKFEANPVCPLYPLFAQLPLRLWTKLVSPLFSPHERLRPGSFHRFALLEQFPHSGCSLLLQPPAPPAPFLAFFQKYIQHLPTWSHYYLWR